MPDPVELATLKQAHADERLADARKFDVVQQLLREAYDLLTNSQTRVDLRDWMRAAEPFVRHWMGEFTAAALGGATGLVLLWIWRRRQRPVEQKIRMTAKRQAELLDDERHWRMARLDTRTVADLQAMLRYEREIASRSTSQERQDRSHKQIARLEAELAKRATDDEEEDTIGDGV